MSDVTEARSDTGPGSTPDAGPDAAAGTGSDSTPDSTPDTAQAAGRPAALAEEFTDEPTADELAYAEAFPPDPRPAPQPGPDLHQPRRGLIAAGEVVAVVALVLFAVWAWNHGITELAYPIDGREPLISTRYRGNWIGTAAGALTLAVILGLDAVRQVVLAVRTRPQKAAEADV